MPGTKLVIRSHLLVALEIRTAWFFPKSLVSEGRQAVKCLWLLYVSGPSAACTLCLCITSVERPCVIILNILAEIDYVHIDVFRASVAHKNIYSQQYVEHSGRLPVVVRMTAFLDVFFRQEREKR